MLFLEFDGTVPVDTNEYGCAGTNGTDGECYTFNNDRKETCYCKGDLCNCPLPMANYEQSEQCNSSQIRIGPHFAMISFFSTLLLVSTLM